MYYPYLAAGYYPLSHDKDDWERDLDNMKAAGISLIRTAEICCSWDQIEPVRGQFAFDWLDSFFDACEQRGMSILLGTGTASPPYWLRTVYPDLGIVNANGITYPNNASYSWACFDHPGFIAEAERYITALVSRYKDREGLFGYQIHNEIGFPFMPLASGEMEIYCYCRHSVAAFRQWLERRYGSIDALNLNYRWNATNERYASFDEVDPPRAAPKAWSSPARWIDWRLFWMHNTARFVGWQREIIRRQDARHPVTTNTFFMKSQDPFGVRMGLDQLEIARNVDFLGIDIYPGSGNKTVEKPEFSSLCLDMASSVANYLGKDFALLETESGPINGWVMGPDRNVGPADIWRNLADAFGHGSRIALFQGYRDWDYQAIQWGGLTDLDGNPTERSQAVREISRILSMAREVIDHPLPRKAQAAIILSKENAIIMQGIGQEQFLVDAFRGTYTALWNLEIETDILTTDMLSKEALAKYKLICLPLLAALSEADAMCIEEYVKAGGCALAGARLGMLDRNGWRHHTLPCRPLNDVFGVEVLEAEAEVYPSISFSRNNYQGYWHKERLALGPNAEADALFSDGTAAAVHNVYGAGHAFYVATHADMAILKRQDTFLYAYLEHVLSRAGVRPVCSAAGTVPKHFDCHLLESETSALIAVTNRADLPSAAEEAQIVFMLDTDAAKVTDLINGEQIPCTKIGDMTFTFLIRPEKERANFYLINKYQRGG